MLPLLRKAVPWLIIMVYGCCEAYGTSCPQQQRRMNSCMADIMNRIGGNQLIGLVSLLEGGHLVSYQRLLTTNQPHNCPTHL